MSTMEGRAGRRPRRKANKYHDLVQQCREKEWQARSFPVEAGCRGFPHSPGDSRQGEEDSCSQVGAGSSESLSLNSVPAGGDKLATRWRWEVAGWPLTCQYEAVWCWNFQWKLDTTWWHPARVESHVKWLRAQALWCIQLFKSVHPQTLLLL